MKQTQSTKKNRRLLPVLAAAVVVIAAAVTWHTRDSQSSASEAAAPAAVQSGTDLVVQAEEIGAQASYFDYDADGTTVEVLAVRASDDTVRFALNTCQVCNGSPYAYFEQDGDQFICQNCMNRFASTAVGQESGGCNPVPITEKVYQEQDGSVTIPASFLEENAARFANWKKF